MRCFRWTLLAVAILAGTAIGQHEQDRIPLSQVEALQVENHQLQREIGVLKKENAELLIEVTDLRGLQLLSQLYQAHELSQKTHDFVVGKGFVRKQKPADGSAAPQ
jgi:hypothetical protein